MNDIQNTFEQKNAVDVVTLAGQHNALVNMTKIEDVFAFCQDQVVFNCL